jgi:multidrug resistance efflux pump
MAERVNARVAVGVSAGAVLLIGVIVYVFLIKTVPNNIIRTSGIIEAREINLAAKISGRITEICCKEGDSVKADQVVIRLDSGDLKAAVAEAAAGVRGAEADVRVGESSIKTAQADVDSAQADVRAAQADVDKTHAQMTDAERQLVRSRSLHERKFASQEALDAATTAYDSAAADYAAAESRFDAAGAKKIAAMAQLRTAQKQLEAAKAAFGQAQATLAFNKAKLADTLITSPIAGTVVFEALEQGEIASPGQTILTIDDMSDRYARVDIDETRVDAIVLGDEVSLTTEDNSGRLFKGRVSEIGRYAEFATQTDVKGGRQDIRTFRVKIAVDDPAGLLKPGMTVEVQIPKRAAP